MSNIDYLTENVVEVERLMADLRRRMELTPEKQSLYVDHESLGYQLKDLRKQLAEAEKDLTAVR